MLKDNDNFFSTSKQSHQSSLQSPCLCFYKQRVIWTNGWVHVINRNQITYTNSCIPLHMDMLIVHTNIRNISWRTMLPSSLYKLYMKILSEMLSKWQEQSDSLAAKQCLLCNALHFKCLECPACWYVFHKPGKRLCYHLSCNKKNIHSKFQTPSIGLNASSLWLLCIKVILTHWTRTIYSLCWLLLTIRSTFRSREIDSFKTPRTSYNHNTCS